MTTTGGNFLIVRAHREVEVYVELEWSWEPGVPGSIALGQRGFYLDNVQAWLDGETVELTQQEKDRAAREFPLGERP